MHQIICQSCHSEHFIKVILGRAFSKWKSWVSTFDKTWWIRLHRKNYHLFELRWLTFLARFKCFSGRPRPLFVFILFTNPYQIILPSDIKLNIILCRHLYALVLVLHYFIQLQIWFAVFVPECNVGLEEVHLSAHPKLANDLSY